jgi:AcrR family transcriptional regulator
MDKGMDSSIKNKILEAAALEIEAHGAAFRMDDLAKRLNISKRTLYENYHSKNDILERILIEKAHDLHDRHQAILNDDSLSCPEKLLKFFTVRSDMYRPISGDHYRLMFASIPELIDQVLRIIDRDWAMLGEFLEAEKKAGTIRPDTDVAVFLIILKGLARMFLYDGQRNPEDCYEYLQIAIGQLLNGILVKEA